MGAASGWPIAIAHGQGQEQGRGALPAPTSGSSSRHLVELDGAAVRDVAEERPERTIDRQASVRAEQEPVRGVLGAAPGARRTGHEPTAVGIAVEQPRATAVEPDHPQVVATGPDLVDDDRAPVRVTAQHGLAGGRIEDEGGAGHDVHGQQRAGESAARAVRDEAIPVEPDEVAERRIGDEPHAAAARVQDADAARDLAARLHRERPAVLAPDEVRDPRRAEAGVGRDRGQDA